MFFFLESRPMNGDKNFFRNNICFTCKDITKQPVKHCKQCRMVPYCCQEHQAADWNNHKTLCKIISREKFCMQLYYPKTFKELQVFIYQRGKIWEHKLKRKLVWYECQMGMYPRVCAICFTRDNLFPCTECLTVSYCSQEHQIKHKDNHERYCKTLKFSLDMDCNFYHNAPEDILQVKNIDVGLKESLQSVTDVLERLDLNQSSDYAKFNYIHNCDQVLSGLTILYALEVTGLLTCHKLTEKTLVLHIVGANTFELSLNWTLIIEMFAHWIFNLELVDITFIGPEVEELPQLETNVKEHFCDNCLLRKVDVNIRFHKSCYGEVVNNLAKPNLVVACNSGFHEYLGLTYDPWKTSISSLIKHVDVPLMLTAYTFAEIKKDMKIVKGAEIVWGPAKNPFSNERPLIDWASEHIPIYYINNFLTILKKK